MIEQRKRRLVRDFSELSPGMLVVISPCTICGSGEHEVILMGKSEYARAIDGRSEPYYPALPEHHGRVRGYPIGVSPGTVRDGLVWRVEDGLDLDAEKQAEKPEKKNAEIDRVLAKVCR